MEKVWKAAKCVLCQKELYLPLGKGENAIIKNGFHKIRIYNKEFPEYEGWVCPECYKRLKENMEWAFI